MDKILITIYVISIEEEYDILFPIGLPMTEAMNLLQNTIREMSNGNYEISSTAVLYNDEGFLINLNNIVKFSGLTNGCRVLLK